VLGIKVLLGAEACRPREKLARSMSEDHDRCSQRWFSGHFRLAFLNPNALPRINIGADKWGELGIMIGVY
jgi:hypothetical protein